MIQLSFGYGMII